MGWFWGKSWHPIGQTYSTSAAHGCFGYLLDIRTCNSPQCSTVRSRKRSVLLLIVQKVGLLLLIIVFYLLSPDLNKQSQQMGRNLLQGSLMLQPYLCIHRCSPFNHIVHNDPSLLHKHSSFFRCFFHTVHSSHSWPSSQSYTSHI